MHMMHMKHIIFNTVGKEKITLHTHKRTQLLPPAKHTIQHFPVSLRPVQEKHCFQSWSKARQQ